MERMGSPHAGRTFAELYAGGAPAPRRPRERYVAFRYHASGFPCNVPLSRGRPLRRPGGEPLVSRAFPLGFEKVMRLRIPRAEDTHTFLKGRALKYPLSLKYCTTVYLPPAPWRIPSPSPLAYKLCAHLL